MSSASSTISAITGSGSSSAATPTSSAVPSLTDSQPTGLIGKVYSLYSIESLSEMSCSCQGSSIRGELNDFIWNNNRSLLPLLRSVFFLSSYSTILTASSRNFTQYCKNAEIKDPDFTLFAQCDPQPESGNIQLSKLKLGEHTWLSRTPV